ncbi:MAG: VWA domain-containing protein [Anaerolineaceae bacterium]|nr:VWA domain-containing protein [Anaerolineaceae bacterium]
MWINPALLAGLVTVAIPVVIHLMMRSRPRRMDFPALRFVEQSHRASAGRTRLKRLLLLALRAGMLAVFVLIMARPIDQRNVVAARRQVPAAAVFCFDNSPSMQYRRMGRSRLEAARQMAGRIAAMLPQESRMAVLDLTSDTASVSLSDAGGDVADLINRVAPSGRSESVAAMLRAAERLLERAGEDRREIYLFTDMAQTAWRGLDQGSLADYDRVPVYVMDVGVEENLNIALEGPQLSSPAVSRNATVAIAATVVCGERPAGRTVVLEIGGHILQRQPVELDEPAAAESIVFNEKMSRAGLVQGSVSLREADPLKVDNRRYFTLRVGAPPMVGVVQSEAGPAAPGSDAFAVWQALAPEGLRKKGLNTVAPELLSAADLSPQRLRSMEAVFLVDAAGITARGWQALDDFVAAGGTLIVLLGRDVAAELGDGKSSYGGPVARRLLGLSLGGVRQAPGGKAVEAPSYQDPALAAFDRGRGGNLAQVTAYRWVRLQPDPGTRTILALDGQPLLAGTTYRSGTVFTLATAPQRGWSNLASYRQANEFVVLLHSLLGAGRHEFAGRRHHSIGQPVTFSFPRSLGGLTALLTGPGLAGPVTRSISSSTATAIFPPLEEPGNYRIQVDSPAGRRRFGFSLNVDGGESVLKKRPPDGLEKIFSRGMFHAARDLEGLKYAETLVRRGRERTAQLIPILMAIMALELLVANRFYRQAGRKASGRPPA